MLSASQAGVKELSFTTYHQEEEAARCTELLAALLQSGIEPKDLSSFLFSLCERIPWAKSLLIPCFCQLCSSGLRTIPGVRSDPSRHTSGRPLQQTVIIRMKQSIIVCRLGTDSCRPIVLLQTHIFQTFVIGLRASHNCKWCQCIMGEYAVYSFSSCTETVTPPYTMRSMLHCLYVAKTAVFSTCCWTGARETRLVHKKETLLWFSCVHYDDALLALDPGAPYPLADGTWSTST